jgi:hypothetical protein
VKKPTDSGWDELVRELSARVAAYAPEWTDFNESDPGITLAGLLAFLGESILEREDLSPAARSRLFDVLTRLQRERAAHCPDGVVTRNRYFTGKLLTGEDLTREQEYHRSKHRRHNRLLHGFGIVSGLEVSVESDGSRSDPAIHVSPGLAIDAYGEELVLCERTTTDACPDATTCYVTIGLREQPDAATVDGEASTIEESAAIAAAPEIPGGQLAIARLIRDGDAWLTDPGFEPARVAR